MEYDEEYWYDEHEHDEIYEAHGEEILSKILANDSSITSLTVGTNCSYNDGKGYYFKPPNGDWAGLGTAVGDNTQLQKLKFDHCKPSDELTSFLTGFASNRSIQTLTFEHCRLNEHTMNYFALFLTNNCTFDCLEISVEKCYGPTDFGMAAFLQMFDYLKEFKVERTPTSESIGEDSNTSTTIPNQTDIIIASIVGHTGLTKIELTNVDIGSQGCDGLGFVLKNPTSKLTVLHLNNVKIDDVGASIFATGLANNHTLTDLKLKLVNSTSDFSWQAIFTALHSTSFRLEKLDMTGNGDNNASAIIFSNDSLPNVSMFYRITDKILSERTAISLSDALLHHSITLRTLTFNEDDGKLFRRNDGWLVISQLMLNPNSELVELKLSDDSITTEGLENLTNVLITNSRLRKLNLGKNHAVPVGGWISFFTVLRNPNTALEELSLYDITRINGYFLICLADALTSNHKLRKLFLSEALHIGNHEIPTNEWATFSAVLRNPNSALEELSLHNIYVNDTVRISLVEALSSNQKLRKLFTHWIKQNDWGDDVDSDNDIESNQPVALCLTRILCNNHSILSTFHSNHTLEKIFIKDEKRTYYDSDPEDRLPKEVVSLLQINRDNCKNQAARLKIIHTHFSGHEIIMEPFMDMCLSVRPHAIAWMAEDNHLFRFLKAMPSLLEK